MRRMTFELIAPGFRIVIRDEAIIPVAEIHSAQVRHQDQPVATEVEIAVQRLPHHAADI